MTGLNLKILAYESSPLGTLCLRQRKPLSLPDTVITEVTLNHEFLMSSLYTDSEEALSAIGVEFHGGTDLKVMVGGLGLGYTAHQALKCDTVTAVEVIEFLPQVINWMADGLVPLSKELNAEDRLKITQGDVYARLAAKPEERYDLILIDVDHSPEDRLDSQSVQFYSTAGLLQAKQHLSPGGAIAIWSYAENSPFSDSLREVFDTVRVEGITHENQLIHERHTDWLFFAK